MKNKIKGRRGISDNFKQKMDQILDEDDLMEEKEMVQQYQNVAKM